MSTRRRNKATRQAPTKPKIPSKRKRHVTFMVIFVDVVFDAVVVVDVELDAFVIVVAIDVVVGGGGGNGDVDVSDVDVDVVRKFIK